MSNFVPGLYDRLVDHLLHDRLEGMAADRLRPDIETVDPAEIPDRVGEVVSSWVREALRSEQADDRADAAARLSGALLEAIGKSQPGLRHRDYQLLAPVQRLTAIEPLSPTNEPITISRPLTPLRDTVLMTNGPGQPSVGREIAAEVESADRIDAVLAFIRWTGIRALLDGLREHVANGKRLRIVTTTYTGSTELRALEELASLGAEIKVSYDTTNTRLHAKAWLFGRDSGFSTVYVGSSNLTFSAQVTGLEWNIRASQRLNPDLVDAFERTFASYWASPYFEDFDVDSFMRATTGTSLTNAILTPFEIRPYPFQSEMLERLELARTQGKNTNLVVAATGTGKTIVAALDYSHLRRKSYPSLLFVAHRSEILQQSLAMFRHVLRDGAFGELWVGASRPHYWKHVFASIQSLTVNDILQIDPHAFEVVIIDEFHHAAAESYSKLLTHLRPWQLLGLTATPERMDERDILHWFGGEATVDLRLWNALEQGLLSPFHYFGISDGTDLSQVTWRRGRGYDVDELTNVYTSDTFRAEKVIEAVRKKIGYPERMRALGFCVSIQHAQFMEQQFQAAGIRARTVTADTPPQERQQALRDLRDGQLQVLFAVDLFNEGVDLPAIDVVLMLRPTESATIFLQQLGRGLRRSEDKDVLTVLDFIGLHRREFRFDLRYQSLLGQTRHQLQENIQSDFPYLPAGCYMELDRVARQTVLHNIRQSVSTQWTHRVQELRALGDVSLRTYLTETGRDLEDVYRGRHTWTELRRDAGYLLAGPINEEKNIGERFPYLLHIDDESRLDTYEAFIRQGALPAVEDVDGATRRQLEGLALTLLQPKRGDFTSLASAVAKLWEYESLRAELAELLPLLRKNIVHLHRPLHLPSADWPTNQSVPLQVHATYTQDEIFAAFGRSTLGFPFRTQSGVYWHSPTQSDLLFVTLQKAEKHYSPTTRYLDYALSDRLFHWESQSSTAVESAAGQRYLQSKTNVVLFIRLARQNDFGRTMPYFCAGTARYMEHRSERPIQITWRLDHPLPGDVFTAFRAAVA